MYIASGQGQTTPGEKCVHKHKYSIHLPISCKFCYSNHILTVLPHSNAWVIYVDLAVRYVKVIPGSGGTNVCILLDGPGHMIKIAAMAINSRNLQNFLLKNQEAYDFETLLEASGI